MDRAAKKRSGDDVHRGVRSLLGSRGKEKVVWLLLVLSRASPTEKEIKQLRMTLVASLCDWDAPSTSSHPRELEKARAWQVAHAHLEPRDIATTRSASKVETPEITAAFKFIRESGGLELLLRDFWDAVERRFSLVERDIKRFENRWSATAAVSAKPQTDTHTLELIERLAMWQRAWGMPLKALGDQHSSHAIASFTSSFHQRLHHVLPLTFPVHLRSLLASSLASLASLPPNQPFAAPSPHLNRLGIISRYSAMLSSIAHDEIENVVMEEAAKKLTERRLPAIRDRIKAGVARWLAAFFEANELAQQTLRPMFARFDYHACKILFDARIGDSLFDIIVRYPDSMPALEDLKECLFKVDQRAKLVDSLLEANSRRLLHPGPDTRDVIDHYIKTIRCLRILDPPGVLLHKVAGPLRRHLRERADTIKCIVATLVDSSGLANDDPPSISSAHQRDETVEDYTDPKWEPEPVDAAPEFRSGRTSDIVTSLVSIYNSHDVIINELQVLLAGRLLALDSYDAVNELEVVELLKLRFGESTLQICDVMLKDIADSDRIDKHICNEVETKVHPLVISRMFWPPIQPSSVVLSERLLQAERDYEAAFHEFKPDKRLRWLQQIGTVVVKLELEDRTLDLRLSPVEATIVELFEGQDTWQTQAIAARLNLFNPIQLRNALLVLAGHGVLREDSVADCWILCEHAEDREPAEPVEAGQEALAPFVERIVDISPFWPMIQASLNGIGPQNTQDLHRTLNVVVPNFHFTADELGSFLANLQLEGALSLHSGQWALPS